MANKFLFVSLPRDKALLIHTTPIWPHARHCAGFHAGANPLTSEKQSKRFLKEHQVTDRVSNAAWSYVVELVGGNGMP